MGAEVMETPDGLIIHGGRPLRGVRLSSHGDHRIAMATAVAALVSIGQTTLNDDECVGVSYPDFFKILNELLGLS